MKCANRLLFAAAIALGIMTPPAHAAPHYPWQNSYKAVVDQTAAVVQGTATSITETYNEREGPRTVVTLSLLSVLWGDFRSSSVTLKLFGGPVPGRRGRVDEVHIPTFVRDKTYLVFLSNRDWRLSPVTARQSFIIERVQGKDIVVTTDGYAVFGIDDVVGPTRKFPAYRIPNVVDEDFVPAIDKSITPSMVDGAYSAMELVAALKAWASRNGVSVNGTFNEKPYSSTNSWRIIKTTPDTSSGGIPSEKQLEFGPQAGHPSTHDREQQACGIHAVPTDADPHDRSMMCVDGDAK